jgi:radical SAM superfamily enzyme YgiQ (UPF0313 family)
MRIELCSPAAEDSAHLRSLALATLAGLTPAGVELSLKDDVVSRLDPEVDLDFGVGLAAITASTKSALRAYQLADAYRRHGVPTVMGGIHPTALPEEALEHCDAVVVGEAEGIWPTVVEDARRGRLRKIYQHERLPDFERPPRPRREIFTSRRYVPVHTVQASRGCPFACEFCSVSPFYGRSFRQRAVRDVVEEIEGLDGRWLMFADDNIVGRREHSRALFEALRPLGVHWFGQASLHGLDRDEDVRRLAASGCKALFIGFESVSRRALEAAGKRQNDPARYLETVRRLHDHGIAIWASFVLGLDDDEEDVFDRTLEFAIRSGVLMALFAILTPYPGTPLHERLLREGRLLHLRWWLRERRDDFPVYRPRGITPEQLYRGWQRTWREFYSGGSILRRFLASGLSSPFSALSFLPLNLYQRRLTDRKILGGDKFFLRDR